MNPSEATAKTILINLDLLFDFYSVLFSAYRTYFAKHSITINNLKHCIEGKSLHDGLNALIKEVNHGFDTPQVREEMKPYIALSLSCIKPTIGTYTLLKDLTKNGSVVKTFTQFEDQVLKHIKESHKNWFDYEIIQVKDIAGPKAPQSFIGSNSIFIHSSLECLINAGQMEGVCSVFVPYSKKTLETLNSNEALKEKLVNHGVKIYEVLEEINWNELGVVNTLKWPETSYFLQLDKKPKNDEYQVWKNTHFLKEPIELTSDIVHGFGRGGKKLGIPTANLDMTPEIEEKLADLVSGVYFGWAEFVPSSTTEKDDEIQFNAKFPMVMSIGFNPYFNNKYKTAEAHIMKKFEHDFYGSVLKVSVLGFIRNEADFTKFSHLIEAIHNDVQLVKDILNEQSV